MVFKWFVFCVCGCYTNTCANNLCRHTSNDNDNENELQRDTKLVENAQHEPTVPWSFTPVTAPFDTQSYSSGVDSIDDWDGL